MNKKGAINFDNGTNFIITLVIVALLAASGIIALVAMKTSSVTENDNTSKLNTTVNYAITGISNFTAQLGTVGTMLGVGLILVVILGVFAYTALSKGGGL